MSSALASPLTAVLQDLHNLRSGIRMNEALVRDAVAATNLASSAIAMVTANLRALSAHKTITADELRDELAKLVAQLEGVRKE